MKNKQLLGYNALLAALLAFATGAAAQQSSPAAKPKDADSKEEPVFQLSPFEVVTDQGGYTSATTLAGNHLNTEVRDIGNAVTVITAQFLKDIGATDNQSLLQYTTNTEVGNVYGNFAGAGDSSILDESPHFINPNTNTRVRGLTSADNTRDYFLTDIPWDGFNVDGVDLQRGANSILFGQGSPAGIINTRTKPAMFKNANQVSFRFDNYNSARLSADFNRMLIKDQLAIRVAGVTDDTKYREDPAFSKNERLFGALRYEPGFLKQGSARTIVKANIEWGNIKSNNPRSLPPIDLISPWFYTGTYKGINVAGQPATYPNLNRITLIPSQNEDDNTNLPNHGQNRPAHNGAPIAGTPNEFYQPWVGNFGSQFGNPTFMFSDNSSTVQSPYTVWEPRSNHGIGSNGAVDLGVGGIPFQRPAGVAPYAQYAVNAGLPYSALGLYKDKSLTDPSVFDFYSKLLDGPNKKEWQNFRVYNLSLAQTFFHDHAGFEATYNNEWWKGGQTSLLTGDKQAIGIDFNSVYSDGSPLGVNGESHADGTKNPNLGRAYVSDKSAFGNSETTRTRVDKRIVAFGDYDFNDREKPNAFTKFLGRHVITGMLTDNEVNSDSRNWQRYGTDKAYEAYVNNLNANDTNRIHFDADSVTPNTVIYLGPSLSSKSSAAGANLPNASVTQTLTSGNIRIFDSTWNKPTNPGDPGYVDPGAYWHNDYYPLLNPIDGTPFTAGNSTQSENPANYVGWRNMPINVIDAETSAANRDYLTHDAALNKSTLSSKAFTWQGHFLDNAIVGTYGYRKDTEKTWAYSISTNTLNGTAAHPNPTDPYGHLNLNPNSYYLDEAAGGERTVESRAWSVVAHLNALPGLNKMNIPLEFSIFYNHSTDFQPATARVDLYGQPIPPPNGETTDQGILIESKDGKYSLKINHYKTTSTAFSTPTLSYSWFIGSSQAWAANWTNRFEFNWTQDTNAGAVAVNDPTNSEYNYAQAPGESLAQAQAREAAAVGAWRTWQKSVDPRFYTAWKINLNDPTKTVTATQPNGFAIPEDSVSKGYEIEFNANPTKNWRLTFNASKQNAVRTNVGGPALASFATAYAKALGTTPLGDLRIWWGGAGNETTLQEWYSGNQPFGSQFAQVQNQEGTQAPELREWRYNLVTNYDFDRGVLKNVNVGAGVRYQSSQIIGYAPMAGATIANFQLDLDNPYRSPALTDFDFWVGYRRRIWKNINWNIQLNVRNAFQGNELIAITTQPDGSPATYRIRPPQVIQLTNTFDF